MFRAVFWVVLPCKIIVSEVRTASIIRDEYNPEDSSEHFIKLFQFIDFELDAMFSIVSLFHCSPARFQLLESIQHGIFITTFLCST
jgi:hypothetical protein